MVGSNKIHGLLIRHNVPEPIAGDNNKRFFIDRDSRRLHMRMRNDKRLQLLISKTACNGQDSIDSILENKAAGLFDPQYFARIFGVVIMSQTERLGCSVDLSAYDNASISSIGRGDLYLSRSQSLNEKRKEIEAMSCCMNEQLYCSRIYLRIVTQDSL